ncbi:hypothetical protein B0H12DRAFT_499211 [Mycena haematopus]|nr:hypothetical protein B0H12DRAFT_499211 [Mycena haematopus]
MGREIQRLSGGASRKGKRERNAELTESQPGKGLCNQLWSATMSEKRKRPPSFQHFPMNRAIKLKQTWVQNQKIKSKWKMEKRKAGPAILPSKEGEEDIAIEPEVETEEPEPSMSARPPPPKKRAREHTKQSVPEPESSSAPSLRDRAREAYSQASLHTYRSDPFGKRPRGGKAGTKGRGQPNMKMRMGVLLETIKRDFT